MFSIIALCFRETSQHGGPSLPSAAIHRAECTARLCRQYLRLKHRDTPNEVERFILQIEGTGHDRDLSRWSQIIDLDDPMDEVMKPLDKRFEAADAGLDF